MIIIKYTVEFCQQLLSKSARLFFNFRLNSKEFFTVNFSQKILQDFNFFLWIMRANNIPAKPPMSM